MHQDKYNKKYTECLTFLCELHLQSKRKESIFQNTFNLIWDNTTIMASSSLFHISTDKPTYGPNEDVIVTATIDKWYPGPDGKMRLVIWVKDTNTHIADKYFTKPDNSDTVKWTVLASTFDQYIGKTFDAQLEFGSIHADCTFTH